MNEKPTPRTDEAQFHITISQNPDDAGVWLVDSDFARLLERENLTFRAAQKACEDCDAPRVDRIDELERELAAERALADRLAETLDGLDWLAAEPPKALTAWKEARK
jgi:hypothetical protein